MALMDDLNESVKQMDNLSVQYNLKAFELSKKGILERENKYIEIQNDINFLEDNKNKMSNEKYKEIKEELVNELNEVSVSLKKMRRIQLEQFNKIVKEHPDRISDVEKILNN